MVHALRVCFFFCCGREISWGLSREGSLSRGGQADIIESLNSTSMYLDDLLNIDNTYVFTLTK